MRRQDHLRCGSITCMIRHYVARRAQVIEDHPHNGENRVDFLAPVFRAALTNAVAEELLPRNIAAIVRLPNPRRPQRQWRSVEEARTFLESARRDQDPLYAAYVLILVLGLRRGEALGLTWTDVDFDAAEAHIRWQLQRAGHQIRHRETKTPGSTAVLPLPDICLTALKLRAERQAADKSRTADTWQDPELVFTSTYGTPYEPRNFNRQFAARCRKAGVRYIRVHDTRRTCASLLVPSTCIPESPCRSSGIARSP